MAPTLDSQTNIVCIPLGVKTLLRVNDQRVERVAGRFGRYRLRRSRVISPWVMESIRVDPQYLDEALSRLAEDVSFQLEGWTQTEVKDYRRLINCARAAKVDTDLRNMRRLRIEPDADDPAGARATLSSGRVITLDFKSPEGPVVFDLLPPETDML